MRILLITDNHTPAGGAENYFFDLKERLKKQSNMEVYSLGFGHTEVVGDDYLILKSLKSNISKMLWRILIHPLVYFKIRQYIKKIRPDIIHIHNIKQYSTSLLHAIKSYPVVHTMHDYSFICPTGQNIHKNLLPCSNGFRLQCFWQHQTKYNRLVYLALVYSLFKTRQQLRKTVKKFIAPSPLLAEYLKKNHFKDVVYIPPFKGENKSPSFENIKSHHFLFAGNLGTHKGVYILLEEFFLACQKNPKLLLYIAGIGPEEREMQKKVRELKLENQVFFLGWQKNLHDFYQECIAVIFPSIGMESFGLVMTEAMGYARPIIGVNRGTTMWLVEHGHNGLLFDPLIKGELAEKILKLAGNLDLAKTLGQKGQEKLHHLINNEEALKKIVAVYEECVTQHKKE